MKKTYFLFLLSMCIFGMGSEDAFAQEELGPSAHDYFDQGVAKQSAGDLKGAIANFDQAIALQPKFAKAYSDRAKAKFENKDVAGAIADYNELIELEPKITQHFIDRGIARQSSGNFKGAIADYDQSIELDPKNPVGYNNIAWLLATASDPSIRDGKKAFIDATKACELTAWSTAELYGTLAAAYAENGNFDQAAVWQNFYLGLNPHDKESQLRLALYKDHKPYHGTTK